METLKDGTFVQIAPSVRLRFESRIGTGTLFLFSNEHRRIYRSGRAEYEILGRLRSGGGATISELAEAVGRPTGSIVAFVSELQRYGLVLAIDQPPETRDSGADCGRSRVPA